MLRAQHYAKLIIGVICIVTSLLLSALESNCLAGINVCYGDGVIKQHGVPTRSLRNACQQIVT